MLAKYIAYLRIFFKDKKTKVLFLALLIFWTPIILFAKLASEIVERRPIGLDTSILNWLHAQTSQTLNYVFLFFTNAGSALGVVILSLISIVYFIYHKQYLRLSVVLYSVGGAAAVNVVLKLLFHRQRPAFWPSIISEHNYSFPSGHAMASSALAISLVLIAWHTRYRWYAIVLGGIFVAMVGLSRLYFGVHFPTDIIAGWCVSFVWVALVSSIIIQFPVKLGLKWHK